MMKKAFAAAMALIMLLMALPFSAMADTVYHAEIGEENQYLTLQDAIDACPDDGTQVTVKMLGDEVLDEPVTVASGKNIVIDLNGYTLGYEFDLVKAGVCGNYTIRNNGILALKNGTVTAYSEYADAVGIWAETGSLTVECNVNAVTKRLPYPLAPVPSAIAVKCGGSASSSIVKINSGSISATTTGATNSDATVVYVTKFGRLTVNGGTLTAKGVENSIVIQTTSTSDATVNGGKLSALNADKNLVISANSSNGAAKFNGGVFTGGIEKGAFGVYPVITGGVYDRDVADYVAAEKGYEIRQIAGGLYIVGKDITVDADGKLTAGTFNFDASDYCADNYACVKNDDGDWVVDEEFIRFVDDFAEEYFGDFASIATKIIDTVYKFVSQVLEYVTSLLKGFFR